MVEEGLLKKRIHAIVYTEYGDRSSEVEEILDEAKKEFPKPKPDNYDSFKAEEDELLEIKDWFKKWFGES